MYRCRECFRYCSDLKNDCPFYKGRYDELEISEIEGKAKAGELLAELYLAVCRIHGERVSQNVHAGVSTLKKLAKKSDLAKGFLSLCYFEGTGVFKNSKKALELCEDVAGRTGCHRLEQKLYDCYKDGIGTKCDPSTAQFWGKRAANHGNEELMMWAADIDATGNTGDILQAVRMYKTADQLGIPQAKERVMDCYRKHIRIIIGTGKYDDAVNGGPISQAYIGNFYLTDPYAFDPQKAIEWYHKSSVQGNTEASLALGKLYIEGEHIPRDLGLAYWYLKQISGSQEVEELRSKIKQEELTHLGKDEFFFVTPAERTRLALYYLNGEGIDKDLLRAKRLLQESEKSECIYAFEKLGEIYYFGLLGTCDYEKAFYYLAKAWAKGSRQAAGILAGCYYNGFGAQKDSKKALELLEKVFDVTLTVDKKSQPIYMWQWRDWDSKMRSGEYPDEMTFAANLFGVCLQTEGKHAEFTLACYEGAAKKGHRGALFNLGRCYENGYGCTKSQEKAIVYYQKGAERDVKQAQYALGVCYIEGNGVEKDEAEGLRLVKCAADKEYLPAVEKLGDCYLNGVATTVDIKAAMECYRKVLAAGYKDVEQKMKLCLSRNLKEGLPEQYHKLLERAQENEAEAQRELGLLFLKGEALPADWRIAEKWLCAAAEQEDMEALLILADGYSSGESFSRSLRKAAMFYEKAAMKGNAKAKSELANCFYYGRGVEKDYAKAMKLYQEAASQGETDAYNGLGNCYSYGYGTTKNASEAVKWYEKAAQEGHAEAQGSLGYLYYHGEGVPKNLIEAVKWFKLSANQGEAIGCNNLGVCYYYGYGVTRDYAEAVKWLQKAVSQNYLKAANILGDCYLYGRGIECNYSEAFRLYQLTAEKNNARAQYGLGMCYYFGKGTQMNREKAFPYFEAAAKQGVRDAKEKLAACYYEGYGTAINYGEAVRWYKSAAADGDSISMRNIGMCYEKGRGVTRDLYEAHDWYSKAIENGYADAKKDLDRVKQALIQEFNHSVEKYKSTPETATYSTSSEYSSGTYASPYANLDYDSSTAFLNRCLRDDLAFSSSERERELVRERYRYNYPDTVFYEDYSSSSYSEPLDDHDYLEYLNDIM